MSLASADIKKCEHPMKQVIASSHTVPMWWCPTCDKTWWGKPAP